MSKIPFYVGNLLACFVPNNKRRERFRGLVNVALYRPRIMSFVRRTYGVKPKRVRLVRQITLNRMVCVVDEKYYVKIFRNVSVKRLQDFKFLLDFIRPYISVEIPDITVHKTVSMYVCPKIDGYNIYELNKDFVLKHEKEYLKQASEIIAELQSVDVKSVPNYERFLYGLQPERTREAPTKSQHLVFAHFDLNEKNFLFDDKMNIVGIIDWDTLSVAKNPETDMSIVLKYWERYKVAAPRYKL